MKCAMICAIAQGCVAAYHLKLALYYTWIQKGNVDRKGLGMPHQCFIPVPLLVWNVLPHNSCLILKVKQNASSLYPKKSPTLLGKRSNSQKMKNILLSGTFLDLALFTLPFQSSTLQNLWISICKTSFGQCWCSELLVTSASWTETLKCWNKFIYFMFLGL